MTELKTDLKNRKSNVRANEINWEEIYRVYNPKTQITTYTLYKRGDEAGSFDNIVILSKEDKQFSYTIRYIPNQDWLKEGRLLNNLDDYTGYINFISPDNEIISELYYSNGVAEIRKTNQNARTQWCETIYEVHWTEATTGSKTVQGDEIIIYEWEVCYNDSGSGSPTNSDNELDSGPRSGGGGITPIGGGSPGINDKEKIKNCLEGFEAENGECMEVNLNMDAQGYKELTSCEKELVKQYDYVLPQLMQNRELAHQATQEIFGSYGGGNGHNDCADAFRHAYFNAINTRTWSSGFAKKWGDAHECDTPSQFEREKEMDLYNNEVGRRVATEAPRASKEALAELVLVELKVGNLKLLSPLDQYNNLTPGSKLVSTSNCN